MTSEGNKMQGGKILQGLRRWNALVTQYNNTDGTVDEKDRLKFQISLMTTIAISLMSAFNTFNVMKIKEPQKLTRYLRIGHFITFSFLGASSLFLYQGYKIYKSIPQARYLQIQRQQHNKFLQYRQKVRQQHDKKKKQVADKISAHQALVAKQVQASQTVPQKKQNLQKQK